MIKTRHSNNVQSLYRCILVVLCIICAPISMWAQSRTVSGVVIDNTNAPVAGASVVIKNTTIGVATNSAGEYSIEAPANATLVFSLLGFTPKEEVLGSRSRINVAMTVDQTMLNDVLIVGYSSQKRGSLTGAVSGIKGDDMITTRNENPQNMLTGKIPGVRVWQKSAEPGAYANNFDIRGMGAPLVVIDGVARTVDEFQRLNPNDIENVSALKDASAAIYGVRAANGVLLVTTKKGSKDGRASVSYNGSFTFQKPSRMPKLADAYQTMTLYNERTMNKVDGGSITYQEADFEAFRNGTRRSSDWNSLIFSNYSPQTQHDISVSGGNEKAQYYVGMGYLSQEGFFKSGDMNYDKYNIHSNINLHIVKGLTLDINLSGMADQRNNPYTSTVDIIKNYWAQGSLHSAYADPENTMLNYEGLQLERNTVAMIYSDVSGYRKYEQKQFQSAATLTYDIGSAYHPLRGLSAKVLFSYDYRMDNNTSFRKEYTQYGYDKVSESYLSKIFNESSPNRLRREMFDKQQTLSQYLLTYNRTFDKHDVSGVFGLETQRKKGDNFYAQRNLAFAQDNLLAGIVDGQTGGMKDGNNDIYEHTYSSLIGRANYAYDNRYLVELQFRYDGSSKFTAKNRWGFFPSASVGWRISEEPFFKSVSALSFVQQLKLRASYGVMGDDGDLAYDWLRGYKYPATNSNSASGYYNQYAPGYVFGGKFVTAFDSLALTNEDSTWATSRTMNLGIDFEGWNGLFGFSIDYFDRRRKDILKPSLGELPTVVGATPPRENLDSDRHYGIDLELTHRNKINDFSYRVKAIGTIVRKKNLVSVEKGPWANSYDRWRNDNLTNRFQGVQFGYESAGRYQNWEDIWGHGIYKERGVLPGDYKYEDWNGDGEINGQDEHPYAFDQTPWLNYSMSIDLAYKNFDFNILLQGSALGSMEYKEPLATIWGENGGGTLRQFLDRWHPVDPSADPYATATEWVSGHYGYTGRYAKGNSEFNRVSTAYLRLKSIELGYTLPLIRALPSVKLRVFANAYNILTFTGVKFVDPEHPDDDLGRMYPLNKTYTLGVSLTF